MREIKFRAWDKNRKKMWSHSDLYKMDCSNEYPFLALIRGFYATNMFPGEEMDVIPMQYTGLKDRNGKEIYEGDILLVISEIYTNFWKTPTGRFSKEYYEVIWKDDGWGHKVLKSDHTIEGTEIKGLKVTTKYVEVIGNIYENPELLEESK